MSARFLKVAVFAWRHVLKSTVRTVLAALRVLQKIIYRIERSATYAVYMGDLVKYDCGRNHRKSELFNVCLDTCSPEDCVQKSTAPPTYHIADGRVAGAE